MNHSIRHIFLGLLFLLLFTHVKGQIITTIAGNGTAGYSGDGGPATSGKLHDPRGVTVDNSGNIYLADAANNVIRKIATSGIISTVCGNNTPGYSGDGSSATAAQLNYPVNVTIDAIGNIYIADYNNSCVRKASPSGTITTIAGVGSSGYTGDGGMATAAQLGSPSGIALDSDHNIYIADEGNNNVRKVDTSGVISTVAGISTPGFSGDGGPATSSQLDHPRDIAIDALGYIYIADFQNHRVRIISPAGFINTFAGTGSSGACGDGGPATSACIDHPSAVKLDINGNVYIAAMSGNQIRKVTQGGIINSIAGIGGSGFSGDGGYATAAHLATPMSVAIDLTGNVMIADFGNNRLRKVTPPFATAGNLTVLQVSDTTDNADSVTIVEYNTTAINQAIPMSTLGLSASVTTPYLTVSGSANSDGQMTLDSERTHLIVAGYNAVLGTNNVSTASGIRRAIVSVTPTGNIINVANVRESDVFDGNNFRSATGAGNRYYGAGSGSGSSDGIQLMVGTSNTHVSGTVNSTRVVQIFNGQLYFSSASGSGGIYRVGTGIPATSGNTSTILSGIGSAVPSPFGFALSPDNNTLFVADDGVGIKKFTRSGGSGSFTTATTVTGIPCRGLTVDFSNSPYVLYATTAAAASPNALIKIVDGTSTADTLAVCARGNFFKGVTFAPSAFAKLKGGGDTICTGSNEDIYISGNPGDSVTYTFNGGVYGVRLNNNGMDTINAGVLTTAPGAYTVYTYSLVNIVSSLGITPLSGSVSVTVSPAPIVPAIDGPSVVCGGGTITLSDTVTGGTWAAATSHATITSAGLVTGFHPGLENITYSVTNGCGTTTVTKVVIVDSTVIGIAGTTSPSRCNNAKIVFNNLVPSSTYELQYQRSGVRDSLSITSDAIGLYIFSNLSAGHYTDIYVVSSNGCMSNSLAPTSSPIVFTNPSVVLNTVDTIYPSYCGASDGALRFNGLTPDSFYVFYFTLNGVADSLSIFASSTGSYDYTGLQAAEYKYISVKILAGCMSNTVFNPYDDGRLDLVNPPVPAILGATSVCVPGTIACTDSLSGGTWQSSATAVATVDAVSGVVHAVSAGTTIITYFISSSCYATKLITINDVPIVPPITGTMNACVSATTTLTDTATGGSWSSSNPAVATVSSSGVVGARTAGTTIITYAKTNVCGTSSDTALVTVNPLPNAGSITGTSVVCQAANTTLSNSVTGGSWTTSNAAIASVSGGLITGVSAGNAIITYSFTNSCGTATDTQMVRVNPLPGAASITGAASVCQLATATLTNATSGGTWTTSNASVASVTAGTVRGVTVGSAIISYSVTNSCGTAVDTQLVTVMPLPNAGTITGTPIVCQASNITLTNATGGGSWSTSNAAIASVAGGGVTGIAVGNAIISYSFTNSCGTATDTQMVRVKPLPNAGSITGTPVVCQLATTTLSNATGGGTWTTSNAAIASVTAGTVRGVGLGSAIISYSVTNSCGTAVDTQMVMVNPLPNAGTITGPSVVCVSSGITLTNGTSSGTWSTANAAIASVSAGLVTGVSTGTTIISYSFTNSCGTATDTQMVRVNPLPDAGAITGSPVVCQLATTTLSNASGGGTWSSGNPSVASVAGGVVRGVAVGSAIISYSVTNSCGTAVDTQLITVNPLPNAGTITGTSVVCRLSNTTLSNATGGGSWTTSNAAIASVSGGAVNGIAAGNAIISYSITNSCGTAIDTQMVQVNPLPNAGTITGISTVCQAATTSLTSAVSGGIWATSNAGVASVVGGTVAGIAAGSAIISYSVTNSCGTATDTQMVTVNPLPAAGTITGGATVCRLSSITLSNATTGGTWSTSNAAVASVSGGTVTGVAAGNAVISYAVSNSCGTATDTQMVQVNPLPNAGTITGPHIVCQSGTITLSNSATGGSWTTDNASIASVSGGVVTGVAAGSAVITYTVINSCGTAADTQSVTVNLFPVAGTITGTNVLCRAATTALANATAGGSWSSSNASIASVTGGVVTGISAGNAIISYSVTNSCGTAVDTQMVRVNPLPDAGLITGPHAVCQSSTVTLSNTATGGTWSTSNASIASVSGGVVTGIASGTVIISYTDSNSCGVAIDTQMVVVNRAPEAGLINGLHIVCQSAAITLADTVTSGTWSSSNTSVATVAGGVVTGLTSGSAIVSYSFTNSCGTAIDTQNVTVNPLPASGAITGGHILCRTSTTVLINTASGGSWSSSDAAIASVSGGLVTGVTAGSAIISYTDSNSCGLAIDTQLIVVSPLPDAGAITGSNIVCLGATTTLSNSVTGGVWTTSSASVASVTGGIVTGVAVGNTVISYAVTNSCGTAVDTQVINVLPLPDAGLITGSPVLCLTLGTTLTNTATGGTWSSSNTSVASVSGGVVTPVALGSAIISYSVANSCGTAVDTQMVVVNLLPNVGTISGTSVLCQSATTSLSDSVVGGSWSSSNASIASVSGGLVSGVGAGSAIISYSVTNSCGTAVDTQMVTVNPLPNAGTITGPGLMCLTTGTTLTNAATGGSWSSSNTSVASVNSSGVITGVTVGNALISYTATNSCGIAIDTQMIALAAPVHAGAIAGPSTVCAGAAILLSDSVTSILPGNWTSSDVTIATVVSNGQVYGVVPGTVNILFTVSNVCGADTAFHSITVIGNPSPGTISGVHRICLGATGILVSTVAGGRWSSSAGNVILDSVTGHVTAMALGAAIVSYTVRNACGTGIAIDTIYVDAFPVLSSSLTPPFICNGTVFNYIPTSGSSAPSFTWKREPVSGITNPADSGIGNISEVLHNVTAAPISVIYAVTVRAGSCSNIENVVVVVNPSPGLSGSDTITVCSGQFFEHTLSSSTTGTTIAWTRNNIAGISPGSTTGYGTINETLINATAAPIYVNYTLLLTANGCSNTQQFTVVVSPQGPFVPRMTTKSPSWLCSSTMYQNYGAAEPPPTDVTYQWSSDFATIYATGNTRQYCLINFNNYDWVNIYLTAYQEGYFCPRHDTFTVSVGWTTAEQLEVIYFNGDFVCKHNKEFVYQWGYDGAHTLDSTILTGETNQNYTNPSPDFANKYYWVMTTYGMCTQKNYFRAPVGVKEVSTSENDLQIFPNPGNGIFTVHLASDFTEQGTVTVTSMVGETVFEARLETNKDEVLQTDITSGVYLVTINTNHGKFVRRLTVTR